MYLFETGAMEERVKNYDVRDGPFALGWVIQVPNQRKNVHEYVIEYDSIHDNTEGWITHLPKTFFVQECLKDAVIRANQMNWRMSVKKKIKRQELDKNRQPIVVVTKENVQQQQLQHRIKVELLHLQAFWKSHLPQHVPIKQPPHLNLHHIALPYKQDLLLKKGVDRGSFKRLTDKRLGMVITQWKNSKTLQTVSTVMRKGAQTIQQRNGATLIDVTCPNDIVMYQHFMGGVDCGDQHRVISACFANVAYLKK